MLPRTSAAAATGFAWLAASFGSVSLRTPTGATVPEAGWARGSSHSRLGRNARGASWGTYRCEKWGPHEASLHAENRAVDWHLDVRNPVDRVAGRKLIELLLAHGADVHARSDQWNEVMAVSPHGHLDYNRAIPHGHDTALLFAARGEHVGKQVAEGGGVVNAAAGEIEAFEPRRAPAPPADGRAGVVAHPALRIDQRLVGLEDLAEARFRRPVTRIDVRVIPPGEAPVGSLDLRLARAVLET